MLELIDRAKVLAKIHEFQSKFNETGDSHERVAYASAEHCMLVIKASPVVEAEPVRHGHWMFLEQKSDYLWKCSNCKGNFDQRFSYCPHCGAQMR